MRADTVSRHERLMLRCADATVNVMAAVGKLDMKFGFVGIVANRVNVAADDRPEVDHQRAAHSLISRPSQPSKFATANHRWELAQEKTPSRPEEKFLYFGY